VREKISVRQKPAGGLTVVRSKSHPSPTTEAFLQTLTIKELIPGSSSVKFCQVAEGSADIYPRFGRTMEWDTAAGHAILNAAGGRVETAEGTPLRYGKAGFENPHFIAHGG
jgi:3'(2'), 5'-bisphosphate nucleotidase